MKKVLVSLLIVAFCLVSIGFASGQNVMKVATFAWQQSASDTANSTFGGWKIYQKNIDDGAPNPTYTLFATIPFVNTQTEYTSSQTISLPAGAQGVIIFVATAFDTAGNESAYSNEAVYSYDLSPPSAPTLFKLTVTITTK